MLVEDSSPDVIGKVSDVIAPHGCCLQKIGEPLVL
jgi:hypothetical protein